MLGKKRAREIMGQSEKGLKGDKIGSDGQLLGLKLGP